MAIVGSQFMCLPLLWKHSNTLRNFVNLVFNLDPCKYCYVSDLFIQMFWANWTFERLLLSIKLLLFDDGMHQFNTTFVRLWSYIFNVAPGFPYSVFRVLSERQWYFFFVLFFMANALERKHNKQMNFIHSVMSVNSVVWIGLGSDRNKSFWEYLICGICFLSMQIFVIRQANN